MSKQALNYLLGQMEDLGYIIRREENGNRRFKRIELTERGVEAVRAKAAAGEVVGKRDYALLLFYLVTGMRRQLDTRGRAVDYVPAALHRVEHRSVPVPGGEVRVRPP